MGDGISAWARSRDIGVTLVDGRITSAQNHLLTTNNPFTMFRSQRVTRVAQTGRRLISSTSVDNGNGASELSLVVKAGSRYESAPGVAHLLQKFAFQDTKARSGLRLQRESELLGGQVNAKLGKENLVLQANFLREDLPYFVEALADTVSTPLFREYQFNEDIVPLAQAEATKLRADPAYLAVEGAYEAAFRTGLANSLLVSPESPLSLEQVVEYAQKAYSPEGLQLFGRNLNEADLEKFAGSDFAKLFGNSSVSAAKSEVYSGEFRVKRAGEQAAVLAFPTTNAKGLDALQRVLSDKPLKWSSSYGLLNQVAIENGVKISSEHAKFSDASLFYVTVRGASTEAVSKAVEATASTIKSIAAGSLDESIATRAINAIKFDAAESEGTLSAFLRPLEENSSASSIAEAAKGLVEGKHVLSVVGRTQALPYVSDLF